MIGTQNKIAITPAKFYSIIDVIDSVDTHTLKKLGDTESMINELAEEIDEGVRALSKTNDAILSEVRQNIRRKKNAFNKDNEDDSLEDLRHSIDGESFLRVIFDVERTIQHGVTSMRDVVQKLKPGTLVRPKSRISDFPETLQEMESYYLQAQMNQDTLDKFVTGVLAADGVCKLVASVGAVIVNRLDAYYDRILHRHSVEGIKIHVDPILTDIAISIFENADASGEIASGKKPDEVSMYSIRKSVLVAEGVKNGKIGDLVRDPYGVFSFIENNLMVLWKLAKNILEITAHIRNRINAIVDSGTTSAYRRKKEIDDDDFDFALKTLKDLDPRNVKFKESTALQTSEERFELGFRNETIGHIVDLICNNYSSAKDIINYILDRKARLHKYFQDENSFYVCKVGNGNAFSGEAPGMLTVIPGSKPNVMIDEVVGSGFDQVKDFIVQIKESAKWHDLFMATSPSKSADKANALLVGPQGCGKSEVLRSVGGDRAGIGIYAQPSDFLTCWKGEAEKNPKRLFEAAVKLQKESGKQVFILIDEIDTILNDDHARGGFGSTNLTTEFQQLMDGIVQYPHIAVWGATNHPERIPMPMIRRFSKVAVVGELDTDSRVKLLKQFVGFLPISESFPDNAWVDAAKKLEGAVGDTIRKVADQIWREKMTNFIRTQPEKAEEIVKSLNRGGKFQIGKFTAEDRKKMHGILRPHMSVVPSDVMASVNDHIENVAIKAEIATAVETYERSRKFLAGIKKNKINSLIWVRTFTSS